MEKLCKITLSQSSQHLNQTRKIDKILLEGISIQPAMATFTFTLGYEIIEWKRKWNSWSTFLMSMKAIFQITSCLRWKLICFTSLVCYIFTHLCLRERFCRFLCEKSKVVRFWCHTWPKSTQQSWLGRQWVNTWPETIMSATDALYQPTCQCLEP